MGKINMMKVLAGGLIAGVVLNAIDYVVFNMALKDQMAAAMTALGKSAAPTTSQILWYVFLDFVAGVFLVWLYAAVRPRFGAGPATAAKAGLAAWFVRSEEHTSELQSQSNLVCRLLLEKKKKNKNITQHIELNILNKIYSRSQNISMHKYMHMTHTERLDEANTSPMML